MEKGCVGYYGFKLKESGLKKIIRVPSEINVVWVSFIKVTKSMH